jgi:hypothetical protein
VVILGLPSKATEVTSAKQKDLEPVFDLMSATDDTSVKDKHDSQPPAELPPAKQEALEPAVDLPAAARQPRLSAEQVIVCEMSYFTNKQC